ncbi:MAG: carboxylesterase family protein [Ardenticatenales bacterium]|nr:carboxylesterase family protein [Ardenticatenales bacterium]
MAAEIDDRPVVTTQSGQIEGLLEADGQCAVFRGIPFAAPPVGPLRWQPPQPAAAWAGVRPAHKFGPAAIQRAAELRRFMNALIDGQGWNPLRRGFIKAMMPFLPKPAQSEDCLYLNVRSPRLDPADRLPVMFWIHGGNHQDGSGGDIFYDSPALALHDVVVVTINYRVGLMGFFAHPELSAESPAGISGNYGLLDQIAALEWVQANIAAFGGDPDNVTIFGQSAGGESILHLLTAPRARGLFHKAIAQSPANSGQHIHLRRPFAGRSAAEVHGQEFAAQMGLTGPDQLPRLRALSATELYAQYRSHPENGFFPVIDGDILPASPLVAFARGEQAQVPLIIGVCADEATLFRNIFPKPVPVPGERVPAFLAEAHGPEAARLMSLYPGLQQISWDAYIDYMGDSMFGAKASFCARYHSEQGNPTFLYLFARVPPSPKQTGGAFHAAELSFVHGGQVPILPMDDADLALAERMQQRWSSFARNGDPNGPALLPWPAYAAVAPRWLVFDHQSEERPVERQGKFDLLGASLARTVSALSGAIEPQPAA